MIYGLCGSISAVNLKGENMLNLENQKVLVFGGSSMIGREVVKQLLGKKAKVIAPTHSDCDLLYWDHVKHYLDYYGIFSPYIINLAGFSGNLNRNQQLAFDTYVSNVQILANVYKVAKEYHSPKILSVVPSCSYPNKDILRESEYFDGAPHFTVESHSLARKNALGLSRQLYKQYKIPSVICCLNNSFGKWDSVDVEKTKAVMGMIVKFVKAKKEKTTVTLWGTGNVWREYLGWRDASAGIIQCFEKYENYNELINIAPGHEVSIKELAYEIATILNFPLELIEWDLSKPDGQKRKKLCPERCQKELEFKPQYTLEEDLRDTIKWYLENYP